MRTTDIGPGASLRWEEYHRTVFNNLTRQSGIIIKLQIANLKTNLYIYIYIIYTGEYQINKQYYIIKLKKKLSTDENPPSARVKKMLFTKL